jgi:hypothetical protein
MRAIDRLADDASWDLGASGDLHTDHRQGNSKPAGTSSGSAISTNVTGLSRKRRRNGPRSMPRDKAVPGKFVVDSPLEEGGFEMPL